MAHVLFSAAHKSSGKTTVTLGVCRALAEKGLTVQPFKKGPDYIDPLWLGTASGRPCHNLDFFTMSGDEIRADFRRRNERADISILEGNKGLYDGLDLDGSNSNAALARMLAAPVILVLDARGMTRGIAPLILGYQAFDTQVNIAGVILNKIGGSRHEQKLRAIIEHYTDVAVIGAVHFDADLDIPERHLGLIPFNESAAAERIITTIAKKIAAQVDLDRVLEIAKEAPPLAAQSGPAAQAVTSLDVQPDVRIAIARDRAFGFYYDSDLNAFKAAGAKLIEVDLTTDDHLPAVDGLFIGGGFPETQMAALSANSSMMNSVRQAIEGGLPTYAECGGLMYLARSLSWQDETREMAGVIPADVVMHGKPQGRGYVRLRETSNQPWPREPGTPENEERTLPAHEFHYSSLENFDGAPVYAYHVLRGHGIDGAHDGLILHNLLASYAHLRNVGDNRWVERFVSFVRACKAGAEGNAINHTKSLIN